MKPLEKIGGGLLRKVALAGALLGGLLAFTGTASAHPRVVVGVGIGGPVVVRGYLAPRPYYVPVYAAPRCYGYYGPRLRYWDARFHCWRYR